MEKRTQRNRPIYGWSTIREGSLKMPSDATFSLKLSVEEDLVVYSSKNRESSIFLSSFPLVVNNRSFGKKFSKKIAEFITEQFITLSNRDFFLAALSEDNRVIFSNELLEFYEIKENDRFLLIDSYQQAIEMVREGPLIDEAQKLQLPWFY